MIHLFLSHFSVSYLSKGDHLLSASASPEVFKITQFPGLDSRPVESISGDGGPKSTCLTHKGNARVSVVAAKTPLKGEAQGKLRTHVINLDELWGEASMTYLKLFENFFVCVYIHFFLMRGFRSLIRFPRESMTLPKMLGTICPWEV